MTTQNPEAGQRLGNYQLLADLGGEEKGRLFAAAAPGSSDAVVIRFLPEDAPPSRALREEEVLRALEGDGVARFLDRGESGGRHWIATAPVGITLAQVAASGLPESSALGTGLLVARALARLHDAGWFVGGLRPERVLVDGSGSIHFLDLHLAQQGHATAGRGTVAFMAPEAHAGEEDGPPADIWALGVSLFVLATGRSPFWSDSYDHILETVAAGGDAIAPPGWNAEGCQLIARLLWPEPSERPHDGKSAAALIETTLQAAGGSLHGTSEELARRVQDALSDALGLSAGAAEAAEAAEAAGVAAASAGVEGAGETLLMDPLPPPSRPAAPQAAERTQLMPPEEIPHATGGGEVMPDTTPPVRAMPDTTPPKDVMPDTTPPRSAPPKTRMERPPKKVRDPAVPALKHVHREADARWYDRMVTGRAYAHEIEFRGERIHVPHDAEPPVGRPRPGLRVNPCHPVVEVHPEFPGCLVSPSQLELNVAAESTTLRFWVTPLVPGAHPEARIQLRAEGRFLEELQTPFKVASGSLPWAITAALGAALCVLVPSVFGSTLVRELSGGFPALQELDATIGTPGLATLAALLFLVAWVVAGSITRLLVRRAKTP